MFVKKHQIGKVYDAPYDVVLGENNVFQPDIMFVSNENSKIITEKNITGAPDLIIEIFPLRPVTTTSPKRKKFMLNSELWNIGS